MGKCENKNIENRAAGCLAGQFCGDAFGSQYEFNSPLLSIPRAMKSSAVWKTAAGQITDDSEMAIELALSIIHIGKYDIQAAQKNYIHWRQSKPFDIGFTTSSALHGALNVDSQANGALMRLSPLCIWLAGQSEYAGRNADEMVLADAALTHPNSICGFCNVIFLHGITYALNTGDRVGTYKIMLKSITENAGIISDDKERSKVTKILLSKDILDSQYGAKGWVVFALHNAMLQLLSAKTPEEAIISSVEYGYDTDTNAAIAGALYGACAGFSAFPGDWIDTVELCDSRLGAHSRKYQVGHLDIKSIADKLLK